MKQTYTISQHEAKFYDAKRRVIIKLHNEIARFAYSSRCDLLTQSERNYNTAQLKALEAQLRVVQSLPYNPALSFIEAYAQVPA